jgi:hypothetical protein
VVGSVGPDPADVVQSFNVFDGSDPTVFESGSGNPVRFDKATGFARITSSGSDSGVRVVIGPGLAGRIAGQPVRVTLVARSSQENGAGDLRFAYENGLAISQWQTAHLGNDFASYDLVWRIPAMRADPGTDQILIEPGIAGDGTAADIQAIKIEILSVEQVVHGGSLPSSQPAPRVASANDNGAGGGVLVAQKAVLYEEPVNSTGSYYRGVTALNATVTWRYVEKGANGPSIEANLQVPQRNLNVKLTIHKNADKSLPASHLIEVQIDAPPDMPGKGIKKVPRIVMKPTEEAQGDPLVGAEAKITDGFFWIALSASQADVSSNLALLRDREWIDLPFVYETGQRAILMFKKGMEGDQVFQKAMAAWQTG